MAVNLFRSLHGCSTIQEENYLTESFVLVLRRLLELEAGAALDLINAICNWPVGQELPSAEPVVVSTQVAVASGIVDVVLHSRNHIVYIEVKDGSGLGLNQLEYYWDRLQEDEAVWKRLVLLSRSRSTADATALAAHQFHNLCWFEVHAWLRAAQLADPVARHYAAQFVEYLENKNMALAAVGWEYIKGVPALINLSEMLLAAVDDGLPGIKRTVTSGWGWRGVFLEQTYYWGVRYALPTVVVFENNGGSSPTFKRDLDLEATHFFALTADEQLHLLRDFVRMAHAEAVKATAPSATGTAEPES